MNAGQRGRTAEEDLRLPESQQGRQRRGGDISIEALERSQYLPPVSHRVSSQQPHHPSQHAVGINLLGSNYYLLLVELRPSKFLPSQLGFGASAGHPDKQTDKQDEQGHIQAASRGAERRGRRGKSKQILLLSWAAF